MTSSSTFEDSTLAERLFRWRGLVHSALFALIFILGFAAQLALRGRAGDVTARWWEGGAALVLAAVALRLWASGMHEHDVVAHGAMADALRTTGPYRFVRHPLYAANVALAAGLGLLGGLEVAVPLTAAMALFDVWLARREERFLRVRLGERYRSYQARVPAFVPLPARAADAAEGRWSASEALGVERRTLVMAGAMLLLSWPTLPLPHALLETAYWWLLLLSGLLYATRARSRARARSACAPPPSPP